VAAELFVLPQQVPLTTVGALMSGALADFFITGTTTRQNTFTEPTLVTPHTNPVVATGNGIFPPIYLDDTLNYKVDITDSLGASLPGYPVDNLASASSLVADLASNANALGASLIGIEDSAGDFTATQVEAALAELVSDRAAVTTGLGASQTGIEDAAGIITATTVETALNELALKAGVQKVKDPTTSKTTDTTLSTDADLAGWSIIAAKHYAVTGFLSVFQNVGNFQYRFVFDNNPDSDQLIQRAIDQTASPVIDDDFLLNAMTVAQPITTMVDAAQFGLELNIMFQAHLTLGATMDFQWAQETSDGNATNLIENSWIRVAQLD